MDALTDSEALGLPKSQSGIIPQTQPQDLFLHTIHSIYNCMWLHV